MIILMSCATKQAFLYSWYTFNEPYFSHLKHEGLMSLVLSNCDNGFNNGGL